MNEVLQRNLTVDEKIRYGLPLGAAELEEQLEEEVERIEREQDDAYHEGHMDGVRYAREKAVEILRIADEEGYTLDRAIIMIEDI